MKNYLQFLGLSCLSILFVSGTQASPIIIDWEDIGGRNTFERQAVTFEPIQVNGFISFTSDGAWENSIGTENSSTKALIFLRIAEEWVLFAEDDSIRGPFGSLKSLTNFSFLPVDFSAGALSGISLNTSAAGATRYFGMNTLGDNGTKFVFSVPEPTSLILMGMGLFGLGLSRRKIYG